MTFPRGLWPSATPAVPSAPFKCKKELRHMAELPAHTRLPFVPVPGFRQLVATRAAPRERGWLPLLPFQRSHVGRVPTPARLSFPSQALASRAATRAAPTKRGRFPLLLVQCSREVGGGACPRPPPSSSPPQTPRRPGGHKAAPENGWLPLLPRSTLTRKSGCPHPPTFVPWARLRTGGYEVRALLCVPARILPYSNQLFHTEAFFVGIHPLYDALWALLPSGPCGCTCLATRVNPACAGAGGHCGH